MQRNKIKKAFSLIELSIVILIISILITGALSASITTVNKTKITATNKKIEEIYKAMGSYLAANGKIPCPAAIDIAKTGSTYGTGSCTIGTGIWQVVVQGSPDVQIANMLYGMVPVKDLGLSADMAEDAFGSKFGFVMISGYNDSTKLSFQTDSTTFDGYGGNGVGVANRIKINEKQSATSTAIETKAMFAIISYGANKSGAYNASSTAPNAVSVDASELANHPSAQNVGAGTSKAYLGNLLIKNDVNSDVFDDIVFFKTRNQMLIDFNLLFLGKCPASTGDLVNIYGTGTFTFPSAGYEEAAISNINCIAFGFYNKGPTKPARKCGALGVWDVITNPCLL